MDSIIQKFPFLGSSTFWIIFAIILILLAVVGYLAENTGLLKKKETKEETKENNVKEVVKEVKYTPLVDVDTPLETLIVNNSWQDKPNEDTRKETTYTAPQDDWLNLPKNNQNVQTNTK